MTPTLFDPAALARRTDPPESKSAARAVADGAVAEQVRTLAAMVAAHPHRTGNELGRYGPLDARQVSRRLSNAVVAGLIVRGPSRKCGVTMRQAATWNVCPPP